ncbi:DUF456 domain-containing protein [Paludibacterium purpuratum]|uniref:DUF456 domain-containing protein n=1 Tax=Paludibacterium purpuratum TaxID=1144873 RepID=A0A4R7B1K1_9NEIS|nr:DUF456 domain-containing protein [Paludibacterium purpuratum]TDR73316.1 hypothetical protein DFP86_11478 [Paludibacterium purpuratum]
METVWFLLAASMVVIGLMGIFLPLLPGVPLIFGGLWLAAGLDGYRHVGGATLIALAVLAFMAWLADYLAAAWLVRRAGASSRASIGAGLGSLIGMFGGLLWMLIGPVLGALLGERSTGRDWRQAGRAGLYAGGGLLLAALCKLLLALAMLIWFGVAWLV